MAYQPKYAQRGPAPKPRVIREPAETPQEPKKPKKGVLILFLVLGLVVVHFFRTYEGKGLKNFMVKFLVVAMGLVWAKMLRIDMGMAVVMLVWPMYAFRRKAIYRNLVCAIMSMVCCFFSVFFVLAPFGCLFLHFYNGEKGEEEPSKILTYLAYPASILVLALAGMFLI